MSGLAFSLVITIATTGLVVGSVYIASGWPGLRRQALTFALLPIVLLAVLVGIDPLERTLPDGVGAVLLFALTLGIFVWSRRRRSREAPELAARRKAAMAQPAVRWLIGAYLVTVLVAGFLRVTG